jgi:hypothetical protein
MQAQPLGTWIQAFRVFDPISLNLDLGLDLVNTIFFL